MYAVNSMTAQAKTNESDANNMIQQNIQVE